MTGSETTRIIEKASLQVGRRVFFSTIIIIASFLPVFLLTGMEGKLFSPLAWTKSFILLVDAVLAVTLAPVLISFFLKGKLKPEGDHPLTAGLERIYTPLIQWCLAHRKTTIGLNAAALVLSLPMLFSLGSEFMPPLDEGSILFMPVSLPDVSNAEVKRILQLQDKIIKSVPEVENVLGKAGRASTATDNSPISMIETIVILKPKSEWRKGMTKENLVDELNARLQIPGVVNGFTQPIINRINMLSTGIRTDVGLKIYGQNLDSIYTLALQMKQALEKVPGVKDLYAEPITGGRYLDIEVKRDQIGRYGLSVDDVNMTVESALGGMELTTAIEGRRRYSVNARVAQDFRNTIEQIRRLPIVTMDRGPIPLSAVAEVKFSDGPPMINSENALLKGAVLFNVRGRDLGGTVRDAMATLESSVKKLPPGYFVEWSGQYENKIRAEKTLRFIVPVVLLIILMVLYFTYRSLKEALIMMIIVPFGLIGGVFIVYFYGIHLSVAVAVGFIALFGVVVETAMLMVIFLYEAMDRLVAAKGNSAASITRADLREYVVHGAAKRLRPKLMTVSVSLFGLIPVLWSTGTGSDVMRPMVIPLIGGLITSTIHVLLVTPVVFEITKEYELRKHGKMDLPDTQK